MNIGQASQACGLPGKTIRFYEQIGLVIPARQESNGYRVYSMADIENLRFLQRARAVGFGIEECRQLLTLHCDSGRRKPGVHQVLGEYMNRLNQQFIALNLMRASLQGMIDECMSDRRAVAAEPGVQSSSSRMAFTLIDSGGD